MTKRTAAPNFLCSLSGQFVIEAATAPEQAEEFFVEVVRLLREHAETTDAVGLVVRFTKATAFNRVFLRHASLQPLAARPVRLRVCA